jgi:hypothetical protein
MLKWDTCFQFRTGIVRFTAAHVLRAGCRELGGAGAESGFLGRVLARTRFWDGAWSGTCVRQSGKPKGPSVHRPRRSKSSVRAVAWKGLPAIAGSPVNGSCGGCQLRSARSALP